MRGGSVHVVLDIDKTKLVTGSFPVVTGFEQVIVGYVLGIFPIYGIRPIVETVNYVISPTVELLDGAGNVLAADWFGIPAGTPGAAGNSTTNPRAVDIGSTTAYDSFVEFVIHSVPNANTTDKYQIRIGSVINYSKFFPQHRFAGVNGGVSYDLIASVQSHERNRNAIDLNNKVLTIVDGAGKGQSAKITDYDAESKTYSLSPANAWSITPDATSRYEITTRLSVESLDPNFPNYDTELGKAPIIDDYTLVLTQAPTSSVTVDVVPMLTRTYNSDEAFNADAAFGENKAVQVHVATNQTLVELNGSARLGDIWVVTLSPTTTKLSIEALLQYVVADLNSDGDLDVDYSARYGSDVYFYRAASGNALSDIASRLTGKLSLLSSVDLLDFTGLLNKLKSASPDPVSAYLWSLIPAATKTTVQNASLSMDERRFALAGALNTILEGASIYQTTRFAGVFLSAETQALLAQNPTGAALVRLNRSLLRDAYPQEIGSSRYTAAVSPANTAQLLITSSSSFYTGFAITPDTAGGATVEVTRTTSVTSDVFQSVAVELTGRVTAGETWTLQLKDISQTNPAFVTVASYTSQFGDTLSDVAGALAAQFDTTLYVRLSGTPNNSQAWTLTLDDGSATPFTFTTAPSGAVSLAQIATGLAAAINGNTVAGYKATVDGSTLVIRDLDATRAPTATLAIGAGTPTSVGIPASQLFDVVVRGRVITISNATKDQSQDIAPQVTISPDSPGSATITPQVKFTPDDGDGIAEAGEWNKPFTVKVMAIDDEVIDGGDALVFPPFEERVNAIRGPLEIVGGALVGEERFLNDPFRLPGETNKPQADGQLAGATVNLAGNAVLNDPNAFHFNGLYGERPGFDPRMNDFPYAFTLLNGPAQDVQLDVASVSKEILSVGKDDPFAVNLSITPASGSALTDTQLAERIRFSGTPEQNDGVLTNATLQWSEVVVSLTGSASVGDKWVLKLNGSGSTKYFFDVTPDSLALSKIARAIADLVDGDIFGGTTFKAEALVDILGNAKIRITKVSGTDFSVQFDGTNVSLGSAIISGTPTQDYTVLFDGTTTKWTKAAFEIISSVPVRRGVESDLGRTRLP